MMPNKFDVAPPYRTEKKIADSGLRINHYLVENNWYTLTQLTAKFHRSSRWIKRCLMTGEPITHGVAKTQTGARSLAPVVDTELQAWCLRQQL